jgi:hypothetical protein
MIFKRRSKLFWVEATLYAALILVFMLGSFGVFDAKSQEIEPPAAIENASCEKWIEVPSSLRIRILQYGMVTELMTTDLEEGVGSLISCLSQLDNMRLLDADIVAECHRGGEEFLADVFDKSLERIVFRCLKWANDGTENFEADLDLKKEGAKSIE